MRICIILSLLLLFPLHARAILHAGVAEVSITPVEAGIPTQLGGYGDRAGKPAEGIHDTIKAKVMLFEQAGEKTALVTLDVCGVPLNVVTESLDKADIEGLSLDRALFSASHTHAGLEGYALDRRNIANNPHIGIFSETMLNFVTDRIAQALQEADAVLQPVHVASGTVALEGMNRNRRQSPHVDEDLTMLRLDKADGTPWAVFVNYTAHGTIMGPDEMLVSGGWPGVMQRTVEAYLGNDVICLYANGAEGDMSPAGARGGSSWEQAEDYGRRVGLAAGRLAETLNPKPVQRYGSAVKWVDLPPLNPAPDFVKIAGAEYHVTEEQLDQLLAALYPQRAPFYSLRIDDFQLVTFPAEPICQLGLSVKQALRDKGIKNPCVASLTTDYIGYILTKEEYAKSGYEVTVSFFGDGLGALVLQEAIQLAERLAMK